MSYLETKPGSLEEAIRRTDEDYQAMFKKELEKTGKSIGQMTPDEKKKFFNKIDKMHAAKNEAKVDELTKAQKKLPPALQKAIKKKEMGENFELNESTDVGFNPPIDKSILQRLGTFSGNTFQFKGNPTKMTVYTKGSKVEMLKVTHSGRGYDDKVIDDFDAKVMKLAKDNRYKEDDDSDDYDYAFKKESVQIEEEEGMTDKGKNKVASLKTKLDKEKDTDALEAQITDLKGQIALLKTQLENEKNSTVKPEPNPETGEVPLTVGVAYKHLRDKMKKEEEKKDSKKTAVGSKANKVDTKPEVEFDK